MTAKARRARTIGRLGIPLALGPGAILRAWICARRSSSRTSSRKAICWSAAPTMPACGTKHADRSRRSASARSCPAFVDDGVTEALERSLNAQSLADISGLTVGRLKQILLSPAGAAWIRRYRDGLRSEAIAAVVKVMTDERAVGRGPRDLQPVTPARARPSARRSTSARASSRTAPATTKTTSCCRSSKGSPTAAATSSSA